MNLYGVTSPLSRGDKGVCRETKNHSLQFKIEEDKERKKRLESFDVQFLRFHEIDVKQDIGGVLTAIENWIDRFEKRQIEHHSKT